MLGSEPVARWLMPWMKGEFDQTFREAASVSARRSALDVLVTLR